MEPLADKIERFAQTDYALEEGIVFIIDGFQTVLATNIGQLHHATANGATIQIRSLEKFNLKIRTICEHLRGVHDHVGPITCHAFIAQAGSPSFGWHSDPDGVWMKVLRGKKVIEYENGHDITRVELGFDEDLYIRPDTKHRVINEEPSVMLSIGLERFMEDKAL